MSNTNILTKTWLIKILGGEITGLLKTDEAIGLAGMKLGNVINRSGIIIWEWNSTTEKINWTGNYEKLFGYLQGTFTGTFTDVKSCIHPDDLENFIRKIETAKNKRADYADEFRIVWPDGSIHWCSGWGWFDYSEDDKDYKMYGALIPG